MPTIRGILKGISFLITQVPILLPIKFLGSIVNLVLSLKVSYDILIFEKEESNGPFPTSFYFATESSIIYTRIEKLLFEMHILRHKKSRTIFLRQCPALARTRLKFERVAGI